MLDLILLVIRAVQLVFDIICLGLSAYLVDKFDAGYFNFSRINYMLFVSIWTLLALAFLTLAPRFLDKTVVRMAVVGGDLLTALFWFAGFIALAVLYNNDYYYDSYFTHSLCSAVKNGCSVMEANVVFGAFEWALFTATTVLGGLSVFRNRSKGTTSTGPSMAPHSTA